MCVVDHLNAYFFNPVQDLDCKLEVLLYIIFKSCRHKSEPTNAGIQESVKLVGVFREILVGIAKLPIPNT